MQAQDQQQRINTKFYEEVELFLCHILASASIMDACNVLKSEEISKSTLEFLYEWMVEQEVDGRAFEIFALALQRPGLVFVSLEQHFASRALQQYKKNHSMSTDYQRDGQDGVDEL
jgi:hypothetical protein